jgi:hypothetical protein
LGANLTEIEVLDIEVGDLGDADGLRFSDDLALVDDILTWLRRVYDIVALLAEGDVDWFLFLISPR